jgi:hypothetical protein
VIQKAYDYYFQRKSVLVETGGILDDLTPALSSQLTKLLFDKEIARINLFSRITHRFVNEIVPGSKPFMAEAGEIGMDCCGFTSHLIDGLYFTFILL